ncbi:MAG: hypothetical protein C0501_20155 [Isosphaera sp.]|nr:hypothetical protein [Isosphaera sp.]
MNRFGWVVVIAAGAAGCALPPPRTDAVRAPADAPPDPTRPLVWVLDGAGDLKGCSTALAKADVPVELAVFPWSHGQYRLIADQTDLAHAREQGARLAEAVRERAAREPGRRVVLVGHSAGCAVVLAAGDALPPDAVDRVVLLAPSVSAGYDLRPTLRAAREGVDVFCSGKDWLACGLVVRVVGTTDAGRVGPAAGRWGFRAGGLAAAEAAKLRQHHWTEDVGRTGHAGGHHGVHAPEFVRAYLFPLMSGGS